MKIKLSLAFSVTREKPADETAGEPIRPDTDSVTEARYESRFIGFVREDDIREEEA